MKLKIFFTLDWCRSYSAGFMEKLAIKSGNAGLETMKAF